MKYPIRSLIIVCFFAVMTLFAPALSMANVCPYFNSNSLVSQFPANFKIVNDRLVLAEGEITPAEIESARQISKVLPEGSTLFLTPSLFGYKGIPSVDGIIYWGSGEISNVSIKSINLNETTSTDFGKILRTIKRHSQSNIRRLFNLEAFAALYHASVGEDGEILIPKGTKHGTKKHYILNSIAKILGLSQGKSRKVTIAITINAVAGQQVKFEVSKENYNNHYLSVTGWKSHTWMNISAIIENLKTDNHIAGFILISNTEAILINPNGFKVIPLN